MSKKPLFCAILYFKKPLFLRGAVIRCLSNIVFEHRVLGENKDLSKQCKKQLRVAYLQQEKVDVCSNNLYFLIWRCFVVLVFLTTHFGHINSGWYFSYKS